MTNQYWYKINKYGIYEQDKDCLNIKNDINKILLHEENKNILIIHDEEKTIGDITKMLFHLDNYLYTFLRYNCAC